MDNSSSVARQIYRWIAFGAMPGVVWSAFEMYVLTLAGPQMLFFSIVHTMPIMVVAVLVGFVCLTLWGLQSLFALFMIGYRTRIGIPVKVLATVVFLGTLHGGLLWWYEKWSLSSLRLVVCFIGIAAIGALLSLSIRYLWNAPKSI